MKNFYHLVSLLLLSFLITESSFGQQNNYTKRAHTNAAANCKTNFTVKPFAPSFVLNKGQFDQYDENKERTGFVSPAYGGQMGNTIVLFNKNSIQFVQHEMKKEDEEMEKEGKQAPN